MNQTTSSRHASESARSQATGSLVRSVFESLALQCHTTLRDASSFARWIAWPADGFALTSYVLRTTGCYRLVAHPDARRTASAVDVTGASHEPGPHLRATTDVERIAQQWRRCIDQDLTRVLRRPAADGGGAHPPPPGPRRRPVPASVFALVARIWNLSAHVTMEELRVVQPRRARDLAFALVELHAIADTAQAGIGVLGSTPDDAPFVYLVAHLLLVARGTLSSFPKHVGVVLPKMRTPQTGLGLRSLSHHVSFHTTEVDVAWRVLPWMSGHHHSVNVLAVPWPYHSSERRLIARPDTFENVRYFDVQHAPAVGRDPRAHLRSVVDLVHAAEQCSANGVQILVLPELAFTVPELRTLADMLSSDPKIRQIPVIVAGTANGTGIQAANEVHLMYYFGTRWYDVAQWKHHRWRLDRAQLQQYELQNDLSTSLPWVEGIQIGQRRLTFVSVNGWLTLCPLICEDLARLEPVSEVIRGVGPTLLFALLMDGPQLKARWPARYATVLAEDPGTAVLCLTSRGMSSRSRALRDGGLVDYAASDRSGVVGLWRDSSSSSSVELDIFGSPESRSPTHLAAPFLTISAAWSNEWTADGRSDNGNAAVFRLDGVQIIGVTEPHAPEPEVTASQSDVDVGTWADLRELASAAFACDAGLARRGADLAIIERLLLASDAGAVLAQEDAARQPWARLIHQLSAARTDPPASGTAESPDVGEHGSGEAAESGDRTASASDAWPHKTLRYGAAVMRALINTAAARSDVEERNAIAFLEQLYAIAATGAGRRGTAFQPTAAQSGVWDGVLAEAAPSGAEVDASTRTRLELQVAELALAVVYARLDPYRRNTAVANYTTAELRHYGALLNGTETLLNCSREPAPVGADAHQLTFPLV